MNPRAIFKGRPARLWLRVSLLAASVGLFFVPWLEFAGNGYGGSDFADFTKAVARRPNAPRATPITWDLVILQPVIATLAIGLSWAGSRKRTADFLTAAAMFIGPVALAMALLEVDGVRLSTVGYLLFALAAGSLVNDLRRGAGRSEGKRPVA